jgi:cytosine/adenosine deaminase-related metal-dependent hydrolase
VSKKEVGEQLGLAVHTRVHVQVGEVRDSRDQRIALSQTHVNPLKWLGMAFLGLVTMLSVAAVHVEQPRAALVAILLFAAAAAPTAAIVLVQGNPFQQPTTVSPAPIIAVYGNK